LPWAAAFHGVFSSSDEGTVLMTGLMDRYTTPLRFPMGSRGRAHGLGLAVGVLP
jgi:hypothetical protein